MRCSSAPVSCHAGEDDPSVRPRWRNAAPHQMRTRYITCLVCARTGTGAGAVRLLATGADRTRPFSLFSCLLALQVCCLLSLSAYLSIYCLLLRGLSAVSRHVVGSTVCAQPSGGLENASVVNNGGRLFGYSTGRPTSTNFHRHRRPDSPSASARARTPAPAPDPVTRRWETQPGWERKKDTFSTPMPSITLTRPSPMPANVLWTVPQRRRHRTC